VASPYLHVDDRCAWYSVTTREISISNTWRVSKPSSVYWPLGKLSRSMVMISISSGSSQTNTGISCWSITAAGQRRLNL
jgi:hypothetical protein